MYLEPVVKEEIRKMILELKNSSPGHDNIMATTFKTIVDHIDTHWTQIYQLSLTQGYFPDELKLAKIISLHKGNAFQQLPSNIFITSLFENFR